MKELITVFLFIISVFFGMFYLVGSALSHENEMSYQAWIKYDGNSKNLTKEEFVLLKNAGVLKTHTDKDDQ